MKVRMKGRDGGIVITLINPKNYDPKRMEKIQDGDTKREN